MIDKVIFYIVAHYDDWQLFCGHQAYNDLLNSNNKVVFIYTTADDAGRTDDWWQLNEEGALASVSLVRNKTSFISETQRINQHLIATYFNHNTRCYCLRLPDGFPHGVGSAAFQFQSLLKLKKANKAIKAVDCSTSYDSWEDFCDCLSGIIDYELQGFSVKQSVFHTTDCDLTLNPNDHTDHIVTAHAIRSIIMNKYIHYQWLTYYSYYCPKNINDFDLGKKYALFNAYCEKTERHPYAKTMQSFRENEWRCWGDKNYSRVIIPDSEHIASYPTPYLSPIHFDFSHLNVNHAQFQRCEMILECINEPHVDLINLFTQKTIKLDEISKIIWTLLREPISLNDVLDIFMNAYPNESISKCKNLIYTTLELFFSNRFIRFITTQAPTPK